MRGQIKAVTISQPWATLLAAPLNPGGKRLKYVKRYLTLPYSTDYRGPFAIHAASKPVSEVLRQIRDPAEIKAIGTALSKILFPRQRVPWENVILYLSELSNTLPRRAVIATGKLKAVHLITPELISKQTPMELALGTWETGWYAWDISGRHLLPAPVTINGQQGLWTWN